MKNIMLALFLLVGVFGLVACNAEDDGVVEEPATEEVENVEELEVLDPEEGATVPHMLGCPCCTSV